MTSLYSNAARAHPEDQIRKEALDLVDVSLVLHLEEGELHHPQRQLERLGSHYTVSKDNQPQNGTRDKTEKQTERGWGASLAMEKHQHCITTIANKPNVARRVLPLPFEHDTP